MDTDAGPLKYDQFVVTLMKRENARCWLCGKKIDWTRQGLRPSLDHVIPRSHGGTEHESNLRLAHVGCNAKRGNKVYALAA